ncbi:hypothetical protein MRB53_042319 [Persea americana]|nr:hypothetical protein MRB53_042319 [Persea americana]
MIVRVLVALPPLKRLCSTTRASLIELQRSGPHEDQLKSKTLYLEARFIDVGTRVDRVERLVSEAISDESHMIVVMSDDQFEAEFSRSWSAGENRPLTHDYDSTDGVCVSKGRQLEIKHQRDIVIDVDEYTFTRYNRVKLFKSSYHFLECDSHLLPIVEDARKDLTVGSPNWKGYCLDPNDDHPVNMKRLRDYGYKLSKKVKHMGRSITFAATTKDTDNELVLEASLGEPSS